MIDVTKHTSYAKLKDGVTGASRKNTVRRVNFSLRPGRIMRGFRHSLRPEKAARLLDIEFWRTGKKFCDGIWLGPLALALAFFVPDI
ncbi:hypothetical protein [Martelella soudanensis]|uniref:hypothetical protein n=1 Tax=unclassified Martelella TaxID=2629616 RepID=UPI0015DF5253|nr:MULTISPECIES: hypothetical protein [unclassified Martelella]